MADNPLVELQKFGQSVWFDTLSRQLITSGELKRMRDEDGVRGVTSNPTIFDKAISHSDDYDAQIRQLVTSGASADEIFYRLVIKDIQDAADILRPVFDESGGTDGFVSVEVSPKLGYDTEGTIKEVRYYHEKVNRPNVMIKIPATKDGLPAIENMIAEGININITLIFSVQRYIEVTEAYLAGLEKLQKSGKKPLKEVASVASFFVSRVDTLVDKMLDELIAKSTEPERTQHLRDLKGKAAVANAKIAYEKFEQIFLNSDRFKKLQEQGAQLQRPLWASTSTKNPAYSDIKYVQTLIGPHTVNTMPLETLEAYKDHGHPALTVRDDLQESHQVMQQLAEAGVDLDEVWKQLEENGVNAFDVSFDQLMKSITDKRQQMMSQGSGGGDGHKKEEVASHPKAQAQGSANEGQANPAFTNMAPLSQAVGIDPARAVEDVWTKNASFWSDDPKQQASVKNRLGWLDSIELMQNRAGQISSFVDEMRHAGFKAAVLLGMGGSSLAPEVLRETFGVKRGYMDLHVLDSTHPAAILNLERQLDVEHTIFIVSSKSGTTTETLSFYKYFYEKVKAIKGDDAGENFIAITDKGTPLTTTGQEQNFSAIFTNPSDIGGRYSALSYFGMVPAAFIGIDLEKLLDRAHAMQEACRATSSSVWNPGLVLGMQMGSAAKSGRNKLTIITSDEVNSFGVWAEQLLAESTGKEGKGILPVAGEPLGAVEVYGNDRLFVYLRLNSEKRDKEQEAKLDALEAAGHPVVRLEMNDIYDLGAEFFRWEFATAIGGAILGINPFNEPNVQESKDNTNRVLDEYKQKGQLPEVNTGNITLQSLLQQAEPGDYIAIQAYLPPTAENEQQLQADRVALRNESKLATTLGFGPRFLHSTGQFHKGGPQIGLFIQVIDEIAEDVPIPGEPYSFGTLIKAQAIGDFQSLQKRDRPVLRTSLPDLTKAVESTTKTAV